MSDAEDICDDDLPMILVNSSISDSSVFAMPSADVVASQRAHEQQCEAELQRLREADVCGGEAAGAGAGPGAGAGAGGLLARSDSSGSEADVLAAGVAALCVPRVARAVPHPAPLLAALLAHVPALQHRLRLPLTTQALDALFEQLLEIASAALAAECEWSEEDVVSTAALLCVSLVSRGRGQGGAARRRARCLHALLDQRAGAACERLQDVLVAAWRGAGLGWPAWVALSDALRSGGGGQADRVSAHVAAAALLHLLLGDAAPLPWSWESVAGAAAGWRGLAPDSGYGAVLLVARLLPAAPPPHRAALLHALRPPPHTKQHQRPDTLKVLVSASRLKLLFDPDKCSSNI